MPKQAVIIPPYLPQIGKELLPAKHLGILGNSWKAGVFSEPTGTTSSTLIF